MARTKNIKDEQHDTRDTDKSVYVLSNEEKWIWVEGYKGTDKDMKCLGFQFELGKQFDMPEDANIEVCKSGFHLCLQKRDVHRYYEIKDGNRFFKVRALVRESDVNDANFANFMSAMNRDSKLAAKSIEFVSELTTDEILEGYNTDGWLEEYKQLAIDKGTEYVTQLIKEKKQEEKVKELVDLGYSLPFATWAVKHNRYQDAVTIASENVSMDVKVLFIIRNSL